MSPDAQRIAIAEACGWDKSWKVSDGSQVGHYWWKKDGKANNDIPDYLSDLNAMRDAESRLSDGEKWTQIKHIVKYDGAPDAFPLLARSESIRLLEANAAQRAEAFLRTLNLFTE